MVADVVVGGVGGTYTATGSVAAAALVLGGLVIIGLVVLLGYRGHGR